MQLTQRRSRAVRVVTAAPATGLRRCAAVAPVTVLVPAPAADPAGRRQRARPTNRDPDHRIEHRHNPLMPAPDEENRPEQTRADDDAQKRRADARDAEADAREATADV